MLKGENLLKAVVLIIQKKHTEVVNERRVENENERRLSPMLEDKTAVVPNMGTNC